MQWAANLKGRLAFRLPEFTPIRKSPLTEYAAIALFYSVGQVIKNPSLHHFQQFADKLDAKNPKHKTMALIAILQHLYE